MKKRVVFRIQLTVSAKDRLAEISETLGITQIAMASKLVEWFADQPDVLQAAVLGLYPPSLKQDIAKLILTRMADGKD